MIGKKQIKTQEETHFFSFLRQHEKKTRFYDRHPAVKHHHSCWGKTA